MFLNSEHRRVCWSRLWSRWWLWDAVKCRGCRVGDWRCYRRLFHEGFLIVYSRNAHSPPMARRFGREVLGCQPGERVKRWVWDTIELTMEVVGGGSHVRAPLLLLLLGQTCLWSQTVPVLRNLHPRRQRWAAFPPLAGNILSTCGQASWNEGQRGLFVLLFFSFGFGNGDSGVWG